MLSLMDTIVSLVVKVLWKLISLICFRVYLEVNVHKNPTCFSRWSVRMLCINAFAWNFSSISLMIIAAIISLLVFVLRGTQEQKGGAKK